MDVGEYKLIVQEQAPDLVKQLASAMGQKGSSPGALWNEIHEKVLDVIGNLQNNLSNFRHYI
jgi:hypothetical protein